MHIEGVSVATVQRRISYCWGLRAFVKDGDKEPSWDGNIYIYKSDECKNEDLIRRVPVQVKGKKKTIEKSITSFNFPVKISDLANYLNDGGVIYFVVAICDDSEQIFYKSLLPYDLKNILDNTDNKYKTIKFSKLPNDNKSIRKIFLSFIANRDCQDKKVIWTAEKAAEAFKKGNATATFCIQTERMDQFSILKEMTTQRFYLYAKTKEGFHIPFGNTENYSICMARQEIKLPVYAGKVKYYDWFYHGSENGKYYIYIGNAMRIPFEIEKDKIENGKFNFTLTGTLEQRITDSNFIVALLEESKEIYMGDSKCFAIGKISSDDAVLLKSINSLLKKTKKA